jgi:hypothetical protein
VVYREVGPSLAQHPYNSGQVEPRPPNPGPGNHDYCIRVNAARARLGLSQFDRPPFNPNPVAELANANTDAAITLKLRVRSQPGQTTLVQVASPVSTGVCCV